jgi:hypothetical protein
MEIFEYEYQIKVFQPELLLAMVAGENTWTRSRCAISMSKRVTTKNGVSVKQTRQSVDGCNNTFERKGTPLNPRFRKGIST